jgi:SAM-dependent methyltransferase
VTGEAAPFGDWPRDELEAVPRCPLCESRERTLLHDRLRDLLFGRAPGLWTLHRCRGCAAGYLDPRPIAASIGRAYGGYYTHDRTPPDEAPGGRWKLALQNGYLNRRYGYAARPAIPLPGPLFTARLRRKADRSIRHLRRPGESDPRLLDLGCGNGSFLARMQRLGWEGVGLEPDRQAVLAARSAGLPVEHGVLTDSRFPPASFEAVTMNHVIEHLHDPAGMLALCHRVLRPGGLLWIATPNLDSLGHSRFGPSWRALEPPRHVVLFTLDALRGALRRAGFEAAAPLTGTGARWMYRSSARLRIGDRPLSALERLREKWLAHQADRQARRQPELAEELVLLARRP